MNQGLSAVLVALAFAGSVLASLVAVAVPAEAAFAPAPTGGADASAQRYRWVDSTAPGCTFYVGATAPSPAPASGCPTGWEDVSSSGTLMCSGTGCGDDASTVMWYYWTDPSLATKFYGQPVIAGCCGPWPHYYSITIGANGYINMGYNWVSPGGAMEQTPVALPSSAAPPYMVAPFWADLNPNVPVCSGDTLPTPGGQGVYARSLGSGSSKRLIIQWNNIMVTATHPPTGTAPGSAAYNAAICGAAHAYATFQVKVFNTGALDAVIRSADDNGQAVTMGIQDPSRLYGLTYHYEAAGARDVVTDRAVRYYPNTAPAISPSSLSMSGLEDTLAGTVTATATDPDYGDAGSVPSFSLSPSFPGSRGTATMLSTSTPSPGTASATFDYTAGAPAASHLNKNGADSFRIRATDTTGAFNERIVNVNVAWVNDPPAAVDKGPYPVAAGDLVFVPADAGLLVGASDPEVAGFRHAVETQPVQKLTAHRDECPDKATWPSLPARELLHGAVSDFKKDGSFVYTPDPTHTGGDFLYFCVSDGTAFSPTQKAFFDVNVVSADILAKSDVLYSINEDGSLSAMGALGTRTNDVLSAGLTGVAYNLVGAPPASAASFTFNPDGTFVYVPKADWNGVDTFRYNVTADGGKASNTALVRLTVLRVNDPPTMELAAITDRVKEDASLRTVSAFLTGVSVGPATAAAFDEGGQAVTIEIVSQEDATLFAGPTGSLGFTGAGANRNLVYRPAPDANGESEICVRARDDGLGPLDTVAPAYSPAACFVLIVDPVADAPKTQPDTYVVYRNHMLVVDEAHGVLANDAEVDNERMVADKLTDPSLGSLSFNPDGAFIYTPKADWVGNVLFNYKAKDETGKLSGVTPVTIKVKDNKLPAATLSASATTGVVGDSIVFSALCSDPEGAPVGLLVDFGDGSSSTLTTPMHSFEQGGVYEVRLTCTDEVGDVRITSLLVNIKSDGDFSPVASELDALALLVAFAGDNQNVHEQDAVTLRGTGQGGDPGRYSYAWKQVQGPTVALADADTAQPSFTAPSFQGTAPVALVFALELSDGTRNSLPDLVQVNVASTNKPPVAHAGADQRLPEGSLATLSALASSDPDHDALSYEWSQVGGTPVTISDPNAAQPSFTVPPYSGVPLTFQLLVSDGEARASALATVLALPPEVTDQGFTYRVTDGADGAMVRFDPNISGETYVWDFGDETEFGTAANPEHVYKRAGQYTVRLTVIDTAGQAQAFEKPITVSVADKARGAPAVQPDAAGGGWLLPTAGLGFAIVAAAAAAALVLRRRA
ncbi:MAG: large repetitive protein [Thermoplasmata archaeon]|nr:large repetitive protein [Thermoplasmata archaeon]